MEMGCRWVENHQQKEEEKTFKYSPIRMELKRQHPGFEIIYCNNIVIDILGGYSKGLRDNNYEISSSRRERQTNVENNAESCSTM